MDRYVCFGIGRVTSTYHMMHMPCIDRLYMLITYCILHMAYCLYVIIQLVYVYIYIYTRCVAS